MKKSAAIISALLLTAALAGCQAAKNDPSGSTGSVSTTPHATTTTITTTAPQVQNTTFTNPIVLDPDNVTEPVEN
jgi:ABC-type glycerol-3-phosphate transport system substrate-binding protein